MKAQGLPSGSAGHIHSDECLGSSRVHQHWWNACYLTVSLSQQQIFTKSPQEGIRWLGICSHQSKTKTYSDSKMISYSLNKDLLKKKTAKDILNTK